LALKVRLGVSEEAREPDDEANPTQQKELNNEKYCLQVGCDVEVEILTMTSAGVDHQELGANDDKVRGDGDGGLIKTHPLVRFFSCKEFATLSRVNQGRRRGPCIRIEYRKRRIQ